MIAENAAQRPPTNGRNCIPDSYSSGRYLHVLQTTDNRSENPELMTWLLLHKWCSSFFCFHKKLILATQDNPFKFATIGSVQHRLHAKR